MQAMATEHFGTLSQFLPMMNPETAWMPQTFAQNQASAYRVLIMERSVALAKLLATGLSAESFSVEITHDLQEARSIFERRHFDLVILDMDTPDADMLSLLQSLRASRPDLRVLTLSGRTGVEDLVSALEQGADDYLFKPFSLLELMARVRALRRQSAATPTQPKPSKLVLHRDQCRVERDGRNIELTPREFALLEYLVQNAGKTVSRALLTQEVWNMPADTNTNIVDVYIKYLRDKIDGDQDEKLIRTVRGLGYFIQLSN